jgi:lipopolysaccharide transport system permease protein
MLNTARYQDLIIELLRKELRVRYKHLALGYVWSIANPLAYGALYYFVFKVILDVKTPNYPLFLVASLFPWQWLNNSILVGPMTFVGNASLIKKTLFPRFLIPLVVVLQDLIHFAASLPIVFFLVWFFGLHIPLLRVAWVLPAMIIVQFVFSYSLNLIVASLNLFFRDLERILQLVMTFLFYMTPVLYSEALIPEKYKPLIIIHPLAPLMINWRNVLMYGQFSPELYLSSCLWAVGLLIIAQLIYRHLSWRFAEVL